MKELLSELIIASMNILYPELDNPGVVCIANGYYNRVQLGQLSEDDLPQRARTVLKFYRLYKKLND